MAPIQGVIAVTIGITALVITMFFILLTNAREKKHQENNKDDH